MKAEVYRSPWFNLEGYLACSVKYSDGSKRTVLQHREVMERKLRRPLLRTEIVHHDDENKRNNAEDNLVLTTKKAHGKIHAKYGSKVELVCLGCRKKFRRSERQEKRDRALGKKGPFCGKACVGRWVLSRKHGRVS